MSLRLRLLVVALLAVATLVVAALALRDLARDGRAEREAAIASSNAQVARALGDALAHEPPGDAGLADRAWRATLRRRARSLLGPVHDTRGGYCFVDGTILEEEAVSLRRGPPRDAGPPPGPPPRPGGDPRPGGPPTPHPPGPPPGGDGAARASFDAERDAIGATPFGMPDEVRAALTKACGAEAASTSSELRVAVGRDVVLASVTEPEGGVRPFALRYVPASEREQEGGWSWRFVALVMLTVALVAVTVDALVAVRRGATGLSRALATIETDLRAALPPVAGKEFADVAERIRRVAAHLAEARERERALERKIAHEDRLASLGRVVAGVAHEVRNPLTGMKLLLDGLARRALDARSAEDVDTCLAEIARLEHLVSSLLGVARSGETGRFVQDVATVVDERIAAAREIARSHGVELERAGQARLFAVRDVLVRVVDNLLRNAIEASPVGGTVHVRIASVVSEGEMERVEIDVRDEGPGVPEAARDELFEPFRTTKAGGTGLGLWLSHTAVTAQGGTLTHRREAGFTHFVVGLPKVAR